MARRLLYLPIIRKTLFACPPHDAPFDLRLCSCSREIDGLLAVTVGDRWTMAMRCTVASTREKETQGPSASKEAFGA